MKLRVRAAINIQLQQLLGINENPPSVIEVAPVQKSYYRIHANFARRCREREREKEWKKKSCERTGTNFVVFRGSSVGY